ncbi:MAG: ABC transporter ATP-binding protein [Candidatus Rokuibacteriota bacterium]
MAGGASPVTLSITNLTVHFGGVAALSDVSFAVRPDTITSLIGPNGAGKTTAFNAITGYLRPSRGAVRYGDTALTGLRPCDISSRGVVRTFQKTSLFPALSVHDNVMIGLHLRGTAGVWSILAGRQRVGAEERALAAQAEEILAFVGLAHRRTVEARALPYGDQRLCELAIALAARPRMLLLDEPAAGMTGSEKDSVSRLIRRIREQGVTVFLVEHDMRVVMGISDTIIVLNHGRVIAEGAPEAIRSHPEVIRAYLGSTATRG